MYKLGHLLSGEWIEHSHQRLFEHEDGAGLAGRLVVGVPSGEIAVFERLVLALTPPYLLLYVLHTPRGEGQQGRYQSEPISREVFRKLVSRFRGYLVGDARFDIWARSHGDDATIVWDRHNLIFAYGQRARLTLELEAMDYKMGKVEIPAPHEHNYREEFDGDAAALLSAFAWKRSQLHPEDEQ